MNNIRKKEEKEIGDTTCPRMDINIIFECSTRYLTSERSERVRCRVEHEKIKFISRSGHVIFCLLYKHTNDGVFDDFLRISDHFPKIFQNCSKGKAKFSEHFSDIFPRLPKISETTKISEEGLMIFRSFSNTSKYFLRDYVTTAMVIILVTKATPTSSHVKDKNSIFTACNEEMRICMASQA